MGPAVSRCRVPHLSPTARLVQWRNVRPVGPLEPLSGAVLGRMAIGRHHKSTPVAVAELDRDVRG
jgi:hypothetical protein